MANLGVYYDIVKRNINQHRRMRICTLILKTVMIVKLRKHFGCISGYI